MTTTTFHITHRRSFLYMVGVLLVLGLAIGGFSLYQLLHPIHNTQAYLAGWKDGDIMSDSVMSNKHSMSEKDIWNFLHSKNPCNDRNLNKRVPGYHYNIKDGHFVCMADESFNKQTTSHIIWQAAQDYNINPQVLIVILEKEQRLVSDTYPSNLEYDHATGFACPDDGKGCRPEHAGFINQVRSAAAFFREVLDGGWSNYPAYTTRDIYYHPRQSCGTKRIYIANRATSALYRYTPYVPNQASLNAVTGLGDACSTYGNRNFYNMFTNWFGDTHNYVIKGAIRERYDKISGGLGQPTSSEYCPNKDTCWQSFQRGAIIWHSSTGAWESKGGIRERWAKLGWQGGAMGYPTGPEVWDGRGWWQNYEHGAIVGTAKLGFWESKGGIRERWAKLGWQGGAMGYPTGPEVWDGRGWWQNYEHGAIVGTAKLGFWESKGGIRERWARMGYQGGQAGYPTSSEYYDGNQTWHQEYEHGVITFSNYTGSHFTKR